MKRFLYALLLAITLNGAALAAGTQYTMRVDGLACPYCAYGIEKKLKKIDGVQDIDIDLNAGVVRVKVAEGIELTEPQMKKLFNDAGFTYRSMVTKPL
ncbi:MAG: heavy-metal-associated domain-containing protein [Sinimarinibacterium flocculans]|uniref:heavy-metal-associated domain-containing protein n=1 Tax=Sinimarinibacterium flocculans TaxID=985250 RepID=UPI003AE71BA2